MPKVLIATEKPFAAEAATKIKAAFDAAKYYYTFLESYQDVSEFHAAVADADALIIRSDKVTEEVLNAARNVPELDMTTWISKLPLLMTWW